MKIKVIAVGKIKEQYFVQAIDEYSKRLSRYCKLEIIQVTDEKTAENMSAAEETILLKKEGDRILKNIKDDAYVISLEIRGDMVSSEELATKISTLGVNGIGEINFIIGGSLGLYDQVSKRADYKLSFSKMTFPHQMMRVILLEQVYRSYRIINGEPYHK